MNCKRFIIFIVFICNQLYAQQTDTIVQTDTITHKNLIDKTLDLFEFKIGRASISSFPSGGYDPSSALSFGFIQVVSVSPSEGAKYSRPTSIVNHYTYSTNNWLNLKSDVAYFSPNGFVVNAYIQYIQAPDKFYGIANDTLNTEYVTFDIKDLKLKGDYSKALYKNLYGGISFDISHTYTKSKGANTQGLDIPVQKNTLLLGIGPHFAYDTRNNVNYPSKGEYITTSILFYPKYAANSYSFYSVLLDAKKYIRIYSNIIWAQQLYAGNMDGDIPFYNLFQLGGKSRMRGISNKNMYINKKICFTQSEIRKHIWGKFGFVAFGGIGNTFDSYSFKNSTHIKFVYGTGLRFETNKRDKINLRMDYGRSNWGDSGFYITMRECF